jgi:hypothetical protein
LVFLLECIGVAAIGGDKPMDLSTAYAAINGLSQCWLRQKYAIIQPPVSSDSRQKVIDGKAAAGI